MSTRKPFWKFAPDELAEPAEQMAMLQVFAGKECQRHIELFERHGDSIHLWKAWRCARACGISPAEIVERFIPHLDKLAAIELQGEIPVRPKQRENRDWILRDYYAEKGMCEGSPNLTEIHQRVSKRHKTTPGRVEQLVLQHEGRDGRSKTNKSTKKDS